MANKISLVYRWKLPAKATKQGVNPASDVVVVYDEKGKQVLEFQGNYSKELKDRILENATKDVQFFHGITSETEKVKREDF